LGARTFQALQGGSEHRNRHRHKYEGFYHQSRYTEITILIIGSEELQNG